MLKSKDEQAKRALDFLDQYFLLKNQLEKEMRRGRLEMSRARMTVAVGQGQYDQRMKTNVTYSYFFYFSLLLDSKVTLLQTAEIEPRSWFGLLSPGTLLKSQTSFKKALGLIVEITNLELELAQLMEQHC
jgi:hypothetical protein